MGNKITPTGAANDLWLAGQVPRDPAHVVRTECVGPLYIYSHVHRPRPWQSLASSPNAVRGVRTPAKGPCGRRGPPNGVESIGFGACIKAAGFASIQGPLLSIRSGPPRRARGRPLLIRQRPPATQACWAAAVKEDARAPAAVLRCRSPSTPHVGTWGSQTKEVALNSPRAAG